MRRLQLRLGAPVLHLALTHLVVRAGGERADDDLCELAAATQPAVVERSIAEPLVDQRGEVGWRLAMRGLEEQLVSGAIAAEPRCQGEERRFHPGALQRRADGPVDVALVELLARQVRRRAFLADEADARRARVKAAHFDDVAE